MMPSHQMFAPLEPTSMTRPNGPVPDIGRAPTGKGRFRNMLGAGLGAAAQAFLQQEEPWLHDPNAQPQGMIAPKPQIRYPSLYA